MLMQPALPLYLSDAFGAGKEAIGAVMAGYSVTAIVARIFSGYLVDSFSRHKVLVGSYLLFALCFLGYPLAGSLLMIAVVRTLHGAPFGLTTVANSTVAVDFLPYSRRAEGIGYYGLSNNVATGIAPVLGLFMYGAWMNFHLLMWASVILAAVGFGVTFSIRFPRSRPTVRKPFTPANIILWRGWSPGLAVVCFAFSYGIIATYIALYAKEEFGITGGTGFFFMLFSLGLITSRLLGSRTLRQGKILQNGTVGTLLGLTGYCIFAAVPHTWGFYGSAFIMGLGNGHMFPAMQSIFMNIVTREQRGTANSTLLTSWELGVGIGTLIGGLIAGMSGYHTAFYAACAVNAAGTLLYLLHTRADFRRKRLS